MVKALVLCQHAELGVKILPLKNTADACLAVLM
jgi:hypothetical protein